MTDQTIMRDTIALETLKIILLDRASGTPPALTAAFCYNMADAMETAKAAPNDSARLDWLLAALDDDAMSLALVRCIALGLVGREAIDAATKTHPL